MNRIVEFLQLGIIIDLNLLLAPRGGVGNIELQSHTSTT